MSSLAAARADKFYYPPEWNPSQCSLNKFHGQHALRERASFEMPFNVWYGGCNSMIAKGVRLNAIKSKWEIIILQSGAQRKTEEFAVTFALPADEERGKLSDPFYCLEHQEEDLQKKKEAEPVLVRLQRVSDARHSDDYALNKALRAQLRNQKKRVPEEEAIRRKS